MDKNICSSCSNRSRSSIRWQMKGKSGLQRFERFEQLERIERFSIVPYSNTPFRSA